MRELQKSKHSEPILYILIPEALFRIKIDFSNFANKMVFS